MGTPDSLTQSVILFDGICNLCNSSVLFVIKRDTAAKFRFASLQSEFGKKQLEKFNLPTTELNSILLIEHGILYQRSSAALRIAKQLSGLWPMLYGFIIIPRFIRDGVYNLIARNRYRWFGKKDACMIPTPELKVLFME